MAKVRVTKAGPGSPIYNEGASITFGSIVKPGARGKKREEADGRVDDGNKLGADDDEPVESGESR